MSLEIIRAGNREKTGMKKRVMIWSLVILIILTVSCQHSTKDNQSIDNRCRQIPCYEGPFDPPWVSGLPYDIFYNKISYYPRLTHDNRVYESPNFLTFSDASEDWAKIALSEIAEDVFGELKHIFSINSSEELGIIDQDSKMTIYSGRNIKPTGFAIKYGYIVCALDSPNLDDSNGHLFIEENYRSHIMHESTHVMQFYLLGKAHRVPVDVWFTEGIAEYTSGGKPDTVFDPITSLEEFEQWFLVEGHVNPINICNWEDYPVPAGRTPEYYPMFAVAFRYLAEGLGKTYLDAKAMYRDMESSRDFKASFEKHIGISVSYYEEHFYDLLIGFFQKMEEVKKE